MTLIHYFVAASMAITGNIAFAECTAPINTPIVPDGNVASKDELLAAQDAVKSFQQRNLTYLECLDAERAALDPEASDNAEKVQQLQAAEAAAIAIEEALASEFNTARKIFLER